MTGGDDIPPKEAMVTYSLHPQGICETSKVGERTRIWAFAHVLPGAVVGADCNLCDHVFVENDVVIGDRVTVKCGVQLWDGVRLEDDVFIGPNVTFTNDRFPRSRAKPPRFLQTVVRKGASIGANATILPGIEIGQSAMVGAGAVVTRSVPPNAIVVGNPARITGYVDTIKAATVASEPAAPSVKASAVRATAVKNVAFLQFPLVRDLRGDLTVGLFQSEVPFAPKRYFLVMGVPSEEVRGAHAHKTCHQFLICVKGACSVIADDGTNREEFRLDRPTVGLYLPPMVWSTQYKYTSDAVLLVFASEPYDADDYVRDYAEWRNSI